MKYLNILILLLVAACGSSKKDTSNDSTDKNTIQLKVNEEKTMELPGRTSGGRDMVFVLSDTSVAKITRKEIVSTYDSSALRPGDPALAIWVIKGLKPGTTKMKFTGPRVEKRDAAILRLRNLRIVVTE